MYGRRFTFHYNCRKYPNISICRPHVVVVSILMQQKYFSASELSSFGYSYVAPFSINEELEKICSWHNTHSCCMCQPCSWGHQHRLQDTKWWCSEPCFCNFQISVSKKLDQQSTETLLYVFFFPFLLIGPVMLLCFRFEWSETFFPGKS